MKTHFVVVSILNRVSVSIKTSLFPGGEKNIKLSQIFHSRKSKQLQSLEELNKIYSSFHWESTVCELSLAPSSPVMAPELEV